MSNFGFTNKQHVIFFIVLILMAFGAYFAGAEGDKKKEFIRQSVQSGKFEVEAGNLALSRASRLEVKDLAKNIVSDHSKANDELMTISKTKNIEMRTEISKEQKDQLEKLKNASSNEFDSLYLDIMVKDHQTDVDTFRRWSDKVDDTELKAWIVKTLPVLEKHLQLARELNQTKK